MSQHVSLRNRTEQHKVKNTFSKNDDKHIAVAAKMTIDYVQTKFKEDIEQNGYSLEYQNSITLEEIANFIKRKSDNPRDTFDSTYFDRAIKPDGGVIYLITKKVINYH